jgi:hypothetical protein
VPQLIEFLNNFILSDEFRNKHRTKPNYFTRRRLLPFHSLICLLLNMNNQSYQDELDRFFRVVHQTEVSERVIFKGNPSKARAKLKHDAFIEMNDRMNNYFYDNFQFRKWHGFTLFGVDGTTVRVPDEADIRAHFGVWNSAKGAKPCPKARVSQMFDVLNKNTVDAIISPKSEGERELAAFHFLKLMPGDLILLDRGYPAHWLLNLVSSMNADFCARISFKKWKVIGKFHKSGKKEKIVRLDCSPTSKRKCSRMGLDTEPVRVRLLRIELNTGETEILVTSLTDMDKYPYELFADLYHCRWPIEEDYKSLKYRLQIENFSGKSVHSVYQDFHAKVFSKNLTAIIATTTREAIMEKSKDLKYVHQVNFAQALSKMKDTIVLLFQRPFDKVAFYISKIRKIFIQTTEAVRPNRKFPRRHRVKQKRFLLECKTTC